MTSGEREEPPTPHPVEHLVVIGSSAGGIDALSSLVAQLPEGFPAPIVAAQYLQPGRRSHLGEILGRRTKLPVVTVEERERLRPGHIYVVPANRAVDIHDSSVEVRALKDGGSSPSVDRLLSTAAEAYGEGVVAVILTGTGSDGASGAREVKAVGGTVVIQNPETAAYPGMPASLAPSTVDVASELEAIGGLLEELVGGARLAPQEELETFSEEPQATVEELDTANDDLEARSREIQRMAASLEEERGRAEEERRRLAAILESMSDAVVVIDASGQLVLTNPAYERIRTATELYGPDGDPLPARQRPLTRAARGEPFTDQFYSESSDGNRFWYEAAARPVSGGHAGMVLVIRDITERSLRKFQEQFLAIASHELRTPLTVLQGYLQMLERQLGQAGGDDARPPYLVKALAQTRRISELITNFLDVSRLQAGKLTLEREPLDMAAVVSGAVEVVRGLAQQQTIHISTDGAIPVEADPARLEQVLLNLLTNAIRYAPDSDRIDVRVGVDQGDAVVEVQDYGPGIPAGDQRRLFRRFYQAPAESAGHGLGLGLHIASEIVKLHGGQIGVRSKLGRGSTFWIKIPVAEQDSASEA